MSKESQSSQPEGVVVRDADDCNIVRDVVLWRRKKLMSTSVLLVATAIWVLLDVYEFNFLTLISWAGMVVVTSAFLWGNILRLLNKEPPDLSGLEISEQRVVEMARKFKSGIEEGIIRWMLRVAVEGDCFTFAGTIAALWVVSELGSHFDLLTLLCTGIVLGMTVPPIYVKYEDKIKGFGERLRMQVKKYYEMVDQKVLSKIRNKVAGERKAEVRMKKIE
ncbi:reticulon-like protein B13 [Rhododendron vialii]|uniref:reticulon-like protein B13 n=1 Tax=Rhododendron vialii TaxID=182163 RepID=UPI0026601D70|nr:reticulon-like protein B13 [Rhododendron vialii]